jgi:tetratricopeptide (TPR) repeat protein
MDRFLPGGAMSRITALLFLIIFIGFLPVAQALDWKNLHSQADKLSLSAAKEEVPQDASVSRQYVLGLVYLNLHHDQEADKIFSRLLQDNPDLVEAKWGKAEVLRRRHETGEAEKLLNAVLKNNPQFFPALLSLGYLKFFQQDFKSAADLTLRVIRQGKEQSDTSNFVRAYVLYAGSKGMLAYRGGLVSKIMDGLAVKSNLDRAAKLEPGSPAVLFGLGSFYLLSPVIAGGDKAKAENYLNRAVEADPLFADAYVRLAQLAGIKGIREKYEFYLRKAMKIDPGNELAQDIQSRSCKFICLDRATVN